MFAWLDRWMPNVRALRRRVVELEDRCDTLEHRHEGHAERLEELRGLIYSRTKKFKTLQEPAEDANDQPDIPQSPPFFPRAPVPSTAHLAHRFRIGG